MAQKKLSITCRYPEEGEALPEILVRSFTVYARKELGRMAGHTSIRDAASDEQFLI